MHGQYSALQHSIFNTHHSDQTQTPPAFPSPRRRRRNSNAMPSILLNSEAIFNSNARGPRPSSSPLFPTVFVSAPYLPPPYLLYISAPPPPSLLPTSSQPPPYLLSPPPTSSFIPSSYFSSVLFLSVPLSLCIGHIRPTSLDSSSPLLHELPLSLPSYSASTQPNVRKFV